MNKKRYCSPVVKVFNENITDTLLAGSNEGTIVVPGEPHDPGEAGANWMNVWDAPDEARASRTNVWDDPDGKDDF